MLPPDDRPRERLSRLGPRALLDAELLELLIGVGTRGAPVAAVARELLSEAGGLLALSCWEPADFARVRGLGPAKAAELSAAVELARRIRERAHDPGDRLDAPAKVWARLEPLAAGLTVEKCWVLCLNRRNRLLALHEVSSGTATSSLLHPREVFRQALRHAASAAIVAHNHPSGDPSPSPADRAVTRQLADAGRVVGVELLDHVVVGRPEADPGGKGWFSFGEAGLI
ncbi:MAG: RadC family protein [Opitutales bacterium]|jgi:DNA repair protein RadC